MNKKWWFSAFVVGIVSVLWQVFTYYLRFGEINPYASRLDYLWFFLSGTLGGLLLIWFINLNPQIKGGYGSSLPFCWQRPLP